jgi:hypothetical protein
MDFSTGPPTSELIVMLHHPPEEAGLQLVAFNAVADCSRVAV